MANKYSQLILEDNYIKSLLIRERYYRDTAQWQRLRDVYHPDATKTKINISWFSGDIDGFVAGSQKMTSSGTGSRHTICPIEVHIHGDKALSESTGSVNGRFEYMGALFDLASHVRFISRLAKVEDEWKLLTLEAIYDLEQVTLAVPSNHIPTLELPIMYRPSYRCLSWLLSQRGFAISNDLPGTDNPDMVEALMKTEFAWLEEK